MSSSGVTVKPPPDLATVSTAAASSAREAWAKRWLGGAVAWAAREAFFFFFFLRDRVEEVSFFFFSKVESRSRSVRRGFFSFSALCLVPLLSCKSRVIYGIRFHLENKRLGGR